MDRSSYRLHFLECKGLKGLKDYKVLLALKDQLVRLAQQDLKVQLEKQAQLD